MSRRKNHNKFCISCYWRGDAEDIKTYKFPNEEETWNFVRGRIRRCAKAIESAEPDHTPSDIDFDDVKAKLFGKGSAIVHYCGCSAWWDVWLFHKIDD